MVTILDFPAPDPTDAAVGARLKRWRRERGMSVEAVATALGLSPREERLAEAGRLHLDSLKLGAAISALRLPLWALQSDRPVY